MMSAAYIEAEQYFINSSEVKPTDGLYDLDATFNHTGSIHFTKDTAKVDILDEAIAELEELGRQALANEDYVRMAKLQASYNELIEIKKQQNR